MIPSAWRVKKQADFSRVLKGGDRYRGQYLSVFYLPSSQEKPRLGITISKKVAKKAVIRNKTRRQVAELLQPILKDWPLKNAGDVIVLVLKLPDEEVFKLLGVEIDKIKKWLAKH